MEIKFAMIFLFSGILYSKALPTSIRIGAIFSIEQATGVEEIAYKFAIENINSNKEILPETILAYDIEYFMDKRNSYASAKKACNQIERGIQALFGPSDRVLCKHIHSICDALDIPHIELGIGVDSLKNDLSINIFPSSDLVNEAYFDVLSYLNWTKVGILYEKEHGMIQLRKLIRVEKLEVHIRQVSAETYLTTLKEFNDKEIFNIIVDTNPKYISILLKSILQLQMNEYKYHYLFTSFDIATFDLEDFKYNFVNMTSFRLVDLEDVSVKETLKNLDIFSRSLLYYKTPKNFQKMLTIETKAALLYDAVYVFAVGLQTLQYSHKLVIGNISCSSVHPWNGGLSLTNYINSVEWKGLTGPIQFKEGKRVQFKLDLVKLKQHSIVKVGEWTPQSKLNITEPSLFFDTGSMNMTLVVITILEPPYVMMRYGKNFTGNERFYGFCVDILEFISREVGFDYILDLVPDHKYGAKDPITGKWNGMVAQLMTYKADLAVGPMTITYARESVIDFTKPFMNLGISILFKIPSIQPSRLFSFMNPLAFDIWLYVLAAYFLVSTTIYVVAKFSNLEWRVTHPCNINNNIVNNQFSLPNSFWFTIGTLMQQNSEINPKALSTRIIGAIWWFFTLIIIASYTANLAAFLTVERMLTPIENAEDLASQADISYGTLESGSTMTFFRDSMIETYRKMWRNMENKKNVSLTHSYEEGIKRVNQGNYAFLMESTMLDYIVQRDCNLTQIGGLLDTKGYGVATPKGSPWRDKISLAILELQEKGDIQMLYDKWWKNTGDTCVRKNQNKHTKANALDLDSIGGVFVVLIVGIIFATFVALCEYWVYYNKANFSKSDEFNEMSTVNNSRSLFSDMLEEVCYAVKCLDKSQRPRLKKRCSQCTALESIKEKQLNNRNRKK